MEELIRKRIARAIENRVFPGCVVGIVHRDGERTVLPMGCLTYDEGAARVTRDTIYDLASITKSIPTASLALRLIDQVTSKLQIDLLIIFQSFAIRIGR